MFSQQLPTSASSSSSSAPQTSRDYSYQQPFHRIDIEEEEEKSRREYQIKISDLRDSRIPKIQHKHARRIEERKKSEIAAALAGLDILMFAQRVNMWEN